VLNGHRLGVNVATGAPGLMFPDGPIRWADPSSWPWVVWAWLAVLLVGFAKPFWRGLQRRTGWRLGISQQGAPLAERDSDPGRIRPFRDCLLPSGGAQYSISCRMTASAAWIALPSWS